MADLSGDQIIALKSVRRAMIDDLVYIAEHSKPGSEAVLAPCVTAIRGVIRHCEQALGHYAGQITVDGGWSPEWNGLMRQRLVEIEAARGA